MAKPWKIISLVIVGAVLISAASYVLDNPSSDIDSEEFTSDDEIGATGHSGHHHPSKSHKHHPKKHYKKSHAKHTKNLNQNRTYSDINMPPETPPPENEGTHEHEHEHEAPPAPVYTPLVPMFPGQPGYPGYPGYVPQTPTYIPTPLPPIPQDIIDKQKAHQKEDAEAEANWNKNPGLCVIWLIFVLFMIAV